MQALLDGTFISQLETYYANTFPMRDTLLKANRWTERILIKGQKI